MNFRSVTNFLAKPLPYLVTGAIGAIVLPLFYPAYVWIAVGIMGLAIPVWLGQYWLAFAKENREALHLEEDFIP